MFIKKLLFLFFSWNWRIWRFDFNIWLIIWLILFFIIQLSVIILSNNNLWEANFDNIPYIYVIDILLMFILVPFLWYILFSLKKKRMNDLWLTNSIFSLNLVTIYKEWYEKENTFWKRETIFKTKISKLLWIIWIIIIIILWVVIILNSIGNMFNSNSLVIESKNKIDNNIKIEEIIWKEVNFWNISWSISTINWVTNISVNYIVNWDLWEWKVLLDWKKENWIWKYEKFILIIWDEKYNLENF